MWVKICANTNLEDARLAVELGADAVGFVFAKSARQVAAEQVAEITAHLPPGVEKIGVFDLSASETIAATTRSAGLTGVQLHGAYAANLVATLRRELGRSIRIIQTNHWRVDAQDAAAFAANLRELREDEAIDAALIDSRTAVADGGTGIAFDWQAARAAMSELGAKPLIVAGGLTPQNVREAITVLTPWGVDVATGVEAVPGKKDIAKLQAFLEQAKR